MKRTITLFLFCTLVLHAFSQQDTVTLKPDTVAAKAASLQSYFAASIGFLSNSVYNGRKDTAATPYVTPVIGYYDKSGFFIDASMSYLARSGGSRIDLLNVEAGYDFYLGNFDGEFSANKSFYNNSSTNVSSAITGSLFLSGGYDLIYIKPSFEAGVNFGNKADYLLSFALEHTFYQLKDKLQFTPRVRANGSTQNYYGAYYSKRKIGAKRKNAGLVYNVAETVADASKFKMLAYECSLPISYSVKKYTVSISPFYAIPVNPALIVTTLTPEAGGNTITRTSQEQISPSFYCSFGISYKF